jgi:hypothetical protein
VCNWSCSLDDYFRVERLKVGTPHQFGPFTVEIHPVDHVPNAPAFGVKITEGSVSAGFTCDTTAGVSPWFYEEAKTVFHDCSFQAPFPDTVHAHFEELLRYPEDWRARTRLVHYGDEADELRRDPKFLENLAASRMSICDPQVAIDIETSEPGR